ncbi:hypothetical protein M3M39_05910 [Fructilactobacillus hinvesii]|uniref:Uncharacterized protein n=1 Tax=Fructilactobacillus hinvesii TaxID=2940300 RepID=A0ABY5BVE3_9LACO|nr:hypothetical protein [Fructilactobacillus hinvesii]USS87643.1 hypothetical protein M3M39_05910 [Fructilactobacillus hinvesii]
MKRTHRWRLGNLTFISICFLVLIGTILLYQSQMTNMYIESNQTRIKYYQHQIQISRG